MATLALTTLASSFAASAGLSTLATIGLQVGASVVGGIIDRSVFGPSPPDIEGQTLSTDSITSTFLGQGGNRVYATAAVTAHVGWASRYTQIETTEEVGGKGAPSQTQTSYTYTVGVSYFFAEELDAIVTLFFDGKPRSLADFSHTFYTGDANVNDPTIEAIEGAANTNPYHGLAHIVFDDMDISTHFSNRPPTIRGVVTRTLDENNFRGMIDKIAEDEGITIDTTDVPTYDINGVAFNGVSTPRSRLTSILAPRLLDVVEVAGGQFKIKPRYGSPASTFEWGDLPVDGNGKLPITVEREGNGKIPARVHLSAPDPARDYEEVPAQQVSTERGEVVEIRTPEVLYEPENLAIANAARLDAIVRRTKFQVQLSPRALLDSNVEIGGIIRLVDKDGRQYDCQIVTMSFAGVLEIEAEAVLPVDPYTEPGEGSPGFASRDPRTPVAPTVVIMELPWVPGAQSEFGTYVAAYADPWFNMAVFREQQGSSGADYDLMTNLPGRAKIGTTSSTLTASTPETWHASETLDVQLDWGTLSSKTQSQVSQNNINALAVQAADGSWEVLQFANAVLIDSNNTWRLSNLYRGRGGKSKAIPSAARAVVLTTAVRPLEAREEDTGVTRTYRVGPGIRDVGHASYTELTHTLGQEGVRPLLPTTLNATLDGTTVKMTWSRDNQPSDAESFTVNIYNGASVVRTVEVTGQMQFWYLEADQITDFGSAFSATDQITFGVAETNVLGIDGPEKQGTFTL